MTLRPGCFFMGRRGAKNKPRTIVETRCSGFRADASLQGIASLFQPIRFVRCQRKFNQRHWVYRFAIVAQLQMQMRTG